MNESEYKRIYFHPKNQAERLALINQEFKTGFDFVSSYKKAVTVFGSARFLETNKYYQAAQEFTSRVVKELDYAVITGGGPGIMEAANRGAYEADGESIGYTIELPCEQKDNPYLSRSIGFHHFFSRKVLMTFGSECYVYFPGGFGTLDELTEILTLIQTRKIEKIPVILYGVEFWSKFQTFIKETLCEEEATIDAVDMDLYTITDDIEEMVRIVKNAPLQRE